MKNEKQSKYNYNTCLNVTICVVVFSILCCNKMLGCRMCYTIAIIIMNLCSLVKLYIFLYGIYLRRKQKNIILCKNFTDIYGIDNLARLAAMKLKWSYLKNCIQYRQTEKRSISYRSST